MSTYWATRSDDLERCLKSLVAQTLPASEIVLVRDGPVGDDVEHCINQFRGTLPFNHLHLPKNKGLGEALKLGLEACHHELVARVDTDDWSISNRFSLQSDFLTQHIAISAVGGWLKEHYSDTYGRGSVVRKTPLNISDINLSAKRRNPVNHPTVMFRRSHIMSCGNYKPCHLFEDYYLWARMLKQGYLIENLPTVLVQTEVDSNYFKRRGGLMYIRSELELVTKLMNIRFISSLEATLFILTRLPIRILPVYFRKMIYRYFLRRS